MNAAFYAMDDDPNKTRARLRVRRGRRICVWIADFLMCWLALSSFVNVVFGIASFTIPLQMSTSILGHVVSTDGQPFQSIGLHAAYSVIGFTYMLWRTGWRFQLSTIVALTILWFVTFSAAWLMHFENAFLSVLAISGVTLPLFYYSICWANQR